MKNKNQNNTAMAVAGKPVTKVEFLEGINRLDRRIDGVDGRLGRVEGRIERVENRLEKVGGRLEKVENRLERVDGQLDKIETNMATKDDLKQFATKDDLKQYATKKDLEQFATKKDIEKALGDLARMIEKGFEDIHRRMATKAELLLLTGRVEKIEDKLGMSPAQA